MSVMSGGEQDQFASCMLCGGDGCPVFTVFFALFFFFEISCYLLDIISLHNLWRYLNEYRVLYILDNSQQCMLWESLELCIGASYET